MIEPQLKILARDLISDLDDIARACNSQEYGLPGSGEVQDSMEEKVLEYLESARQL